MSYNSQTERLQFVDCQPVEQATTGRRGHTVNQQQAGWTMARWAF